MTPAVPDTAPAKSADATACTCDALPLSMRARAMVGLWTLVRKEVGRFLRIWTQTLLPPAITMTLYFVIFGNLIGGRIGEMGGTNYVSFIMPGLVMMAVITASYTNVVSSFFSSKFQHNVEELLVSPMPNWAILVGYITGGVARGLLVGVVVMAISLFFTHVTVHNIFLTASVVLLTAVLFATGGFLNALFARKFDDVAIVPTFILTPLTYLGGVFYSIKMLPAFWQNVSLANPILYMVNAFRYGILGPGPAGTVVSDVRIDVAFAMIVISIILLFTATLHMLNKGVGLRS